MSNSKFVPELELRQERVFRVVGKVPPSNDGDVNNKLIKLNKRLRYGRQPIPGVSSGRYRKLIYK